jgi:hypothetical protein
MQSDAHTVDVQSVAVDDTGLPDYRLLGMRMRAGEHRQYDKHLKHFGFPQVG